MAKVPHQCSVSAAYSVNSNAYFAQRWAVRLMCSTHTCTHAGLMTILPGETPLVILCSHLSCPRPHSELNGWCDYMKACCLSKAWFHSNTRNACKALCKKKYACKIKSTQETQQMQKNYARKKTKVRKRKSRN